MRLVWIADVTVGRGTNLMAKVYWKMNTDTYEHYLHILEQIDLKHPEYQVEEIEELVSFLTHLPGFPLTKDDDDVVVPVLNTKVPIVVENVAD